MHILATEALASSGLFSLEIKKRAKDIDKLYFSIKISLFQVVSEILTNR